MTPEEFHKELSSVTTYRESRIQCTQLVLNNMYLLPSLISYLFKSNDKLSCQAASILELVCINQPYAISPHLDRFTQNIHKVTLETAIRHVSKICQLIAQAYVSKKHNVIKNNLSSNHTGHIVETCFDWLINEHKVVPKVFAMETLFLLGQEDQWIHDDLKQLLEKDFSTQSAAYKSRAKHVLARMKKLQNLGYKSKNRNS
jgi:hypothetical protein